MALRSLGFARVFETWRLISGALRYLVAVSARLRAKLRLVAPDRGEPARATPVPALLDDSELVAATKACDEGAAGALHDRLLPRVELTIGRLLGRGDMDYDDVIQLSVIAIVEGVERYRGECSLDAWAGTVTAHVVYNHIRRRRLERRIFSSAAADDPAEVSASTSFGRAIVARDLVRRVREHLNELEPDKAWTFLLHDVCGFDVKEVASITNVSVAAAQRRLARGRHEIHACLAADPELAHCITEMEPES